MSPVQAILADIRARYNPGSKQPVDAWMALADLLTEQGSPAAEAAREIAYFMQDKQLAGHGLRPVFTHNPRRWLGRLTSWLKSGEPAPVGWMGWWDWECQWPLD